MRNVRDVECDGVREIIDGPQFVSMGWWLSGWIPVIQALKATGMPLRMSEFPYPTGGDSVEVFVDASADMHDVHKAMIDMGLEMFS